MVIIISTATFIIKITCKFVLTGIIFQTETCMTVNIIIRYDLKKKLDRPRYKI